MRRASPSHRVPAWGALALGATLVVLLVGVVMGQSHEPVAIEPDAPAASGQQVATFALG